MAEMMNITAQEAVLRKQCQGFLSIVTAMQVKESSLCSWLFFFPFTFFFLIKLL